MNGINVPIPDRMRHLELDRRGYPIPWNLYRDPDGRAHFQINDHVLNAKALAEDLCPICGTKLFRGRWFVGGPLSAFHPDGAYFDAPMHHECATYALQVCPWLAAPRYMSRIDDKTLAPDDPVGVLIDHTQIPTRPEIFVSAMATGQILKGTHIIPRRPFARVEFWRGGARIPDSEGWAIVAGKIAQPLPERKQPRILDRRR
jgi:hypothetical protein